MNNASINRAREMLLGIREIVSTEAFDGASLSSDADFAGRLAALSIEFRALQATASRTEVHDLVVSITASDLLRRLAGLAMDALGIYAIPDQTSLSPGANAYPVGPDGAARIVSDYIEFSSRDDATPLRDQLSTIILER